MRNKHENSNVNIFQSFVHFRVTNMYLLIKYIGILTIKRFSYSKTF